MRRVLVAVMVTVPALAGTSGQALADTWSGSIDLVTTGQITSSNMTGRPTVASWAPERLDLFWRNATSNQLMSAYYANSAWHGSSSINATAITSDPSCVSWGPNRIDCFARDTSGKLTTIFYGSSGWSAFSSFSSDALPASAAPNVTSWGPNRLDVFWRSATGTLMQKTYASGWQTAIDRGGSFVGQPACVSWGLNRIDCFVAGTDGLLKQGYFNGTTMTWFSLGDSLAANAAVAVTSWSPYRLDVVYIGSDAQYHQKVYSKTAWQTPVTIPNLSSSGAGCVSWGFGRIDCFSNQGSGDVSWSAFLNRMRSENSQTGTTAWQLANPAKNHEIEGYASATSVNAGSSISLYVRVDNPAVYGTYTASVYRMGWYNGAGGRLMTTVGPLTSQGGTTGQPIPTMDPYGTFDCAWSLSNSLAIPSTWTSGVYLVKLQTSLDASGNRKESYIIFTVRNDSLTTDILFQSSVTTWQAYNNWPGVARGGKALYPLLSSGSVEAVKVSFNRPYAIAVDQTAAAGVGAGEFLTNENINPSFGGGGGLMNGWEYPMVRFLEREGYDVSYMTDIDLYNAAFVTPNIFTAASHLAFLSVGHDEYWTLEMRDQIKFRRDHGVNLGFFSSNVMFHQSRLDIPWQSGQSLHCSPTGAVSARRILVAYHGYPDECQPNYPDNWLCGAGGSIGCYSSQEDEIVGVRSPAGLFVFAPTTSASVPSLSANIVLANTSAAPWAFNKATAGGAPVGNGTVLQSLLGCEADYWYGPNAPPVSPPISPPPAAGPHASDFVMMGQSPYTNDNSGGQGAVGHMGYYLVPTTGGIVFATGSMQWSWGLSGFDSSTGGYDSVPSDGQVIAAVPAAQQITRNVLNRLISPGF